MAHFLNLSILRLLAFSLTTSRHLLTNSKIDFRNLFLQLFQEVSFLDRAGLSTSSGYILVCEATPAIEPAISLSLTPSCFSSAPNSFFAWRTNNPSVNYILYQMTERERTWTILEGFLSLKTARKIMADKDPLVGLRKDLKILLNPRISMNILPTVLYTFLMVQTRRICSTITSFSHGWSFPLFSWPLCLIQQWYCKEK